MDRDARRMRGPRPFLFTNLRAGHGVAEVADFLIRMGGFEANPSLLLDQCDEKRL
jgi:urease accessory protein